MKITESQLRRIIREELLREAGPGLVGNAPGAIEEPEFLAKIKEIAGQHPDMTASEVVEDVLAYFSEDGRGIAEEDKYLLASANLRVELGRNIDPDESRGVINAAEAAATAAGLEVDDDEGVLTIYGPYAFLESEVLQDRIKKQFPPRVFDRVRFNGPVIYGNEPIISFPRRPPAY